MNNQQTDELQSHAVIAEILLEELLLLKALKSRDASDIMKLDKLTKIYSALMGSYRAGKKDGLFTETEESAT